MSNINIQSVSQYMLKCNEKLQLLEEYKLLNFVNLYNHSMLSFYPFNAIERIQSEFEINIIMKYKKYHFYLGQWNDLTQKPDGLGLALNQHGDLVQGSFANGELVMPYIQMNK